MAEKNPKRKAFLQDRFWGIFDNLASNTLWIVLGVALLGLGTFVAARGPLPAALVLLIAVALILMAVLFLKWRRTSSNRARETRIAQPFTAVPWLWKPEDLAPSISNELEKLIAAERGGSGSAPHYELGRFYQGRLSDPALAMWCFISAIIDNPAASPPFDRIAEIWAELEQHDQAIEWYKRSAQADPGNNWPCDRLGDLFSKMERYDQALEWFNESIRRKPKGNSIPYDRIAEIYRDHRQDDDCAIEWFIKSTQADRGNEWPCYQLGLMYRDRKRQMQEAIEWFRESIRRKPRCAWPYNRIAEIYRDYYRDNAEAISCFERGQQVDPNDAEGKAELEKLKPAKA